MKILVVQDRLRSGGTERQSILLARAFAAAGHPTKLLTFRPGGALAPTLAGVDHQALQARDLGLDWFAPGLRQAAVRFEPTVVLCMGRMANCHAGSLQRALPRAAVLGTMRTGKRLPWLFRRSLHRVRHVVANSHGAKDTLGRDYALPADKISVIHNSLVFASATDLERNRALRASLGATAETCVLLCVAMFRPEKNQRALLEIAARLPRDNAWQLWLAGEGPARPACEKLAAERGLGERVKFLGFQRNPAPLYAAADVAVLASRSESLSNFLIEAQAHRLPAVAYDAQGVGETFLPDESGYLIPEGHADQFLRALGLLLTDPAQRAEMGARGRAHALESFAPERQVRAYLDLFTRLATPSPTP